MNQLTQREQKPFILFPESVVPRKVWIDDVITTYMAFCEEYEDIPISPFDVARNIDLFKKATFARVCMLGERSNDMFNNDDDLIDIYEDCDGDLEQAVETYNEHYSMFSMGRDGQKHFMHDIAIALEESQVFYLNAPAPYDTLRFVRDHLNKSPAIEPMLSQVLRNTPVVRVW